MWLNLEENRNNQGLRCLGSLYVLEVTSHFLLLYIIAHILGIVVWEDDHGDSSDISDSSNSSRNNGRGKETHWTLSTVLCVSGATSLAPCRIFMV